MRMEILSFKDFSDLKDSVLMIYFSDTSFYF